MLCRLQGEHFALAASGLPDHDLMQLAWRVEARAIRGENDGANAIRCSRQVCPNFAGIGPPQFFAGRRVPGDQVGADRDDRFFVGESQLDHARGRAKPQGTEPQPSARRQWIAE